MNDARAFVRPLRTSVCIIPTFSNERQREDYRQIRLYRNTKTKATTIRNGHLCDRLKADRENSRTSVCALLLPSFMNAEYNEFEQRKIQEL